MHTVAGAVAAILVILSSHLGAAATPATSAPTTRAASDRRADAAAARHPAVQAAVAELTREIEAALAAGEGSPRVHGDYFPAVLAADLPPAAVTAALRRPISSDPRVAAYVKWQLLSGLPKDVDEKTAAELLQAYRAAPPPLPRPGLEKQHRDELDRMIRGARENDEEALANRFEQIVERIARDNRYLLAYRDELFARLPPGYDALAAGLDDAAARMKVGADAAEHTRIVCKLIPQWATADAPPEQLRAMSRAIAQLERKKGQEYYNRLYWSASYGRMTFSRSRGSLASVSQLEAVQEFLDDRIRNPTSPLKLKEER